MKKTPSMKFFFNKAYNGWGYKCFGCGMSGDVFKFLMKYDRCEFWDAMAYVIKGKHVFVYNPNLPQKPQLLIQQRITFPELELPDDGLPF